MLRCSKWTIRMAIRWDALILAGVLAGGSLLIENSHRLDTGAPDEEMVAASTCDGVAAERYEWKPFAQPTSDDTDEIVSAKAPASCASE
jgi:hypothetical protein